MTYAWEFCLCLLAGYYLGTCAKSLAAWIVSGSRSGIVTILLGLGLFLVAFLDRSVLTVLPCFAAGLGIMWYGRRKSGLYRDGD